jgi:hypothetical protein
VQRLFGIRKEQICEKEKQNKSCNILRQKNKMNKQFYSAAKISTFWARKMFLICQLYWARVKDPEESRR